MNIAIVGTGYVGLVTGTCLANFGNKVICVDIDTDKVTKMKKGELPIYEPQLEEIFTKNIEAGRLYFTTRLEDAVEECQVFFLALPTPPGEDGSADLSYVLKVAEDLSHLIKKYTVVVNKSTVPVGTAEKVRNLMSSYTDIKFDVVSNPEFLREGLAVEDFMHPSRVIIGSESQPAIDVMKKIYHPLTLNGTPIMVMDEKSSELTKYAANSFLATKITFMNEIANYCEKVGADVDKVRLGMGADDRIGHRFLFPGIGYGGSCFPKDVKALVNACQQEGYDFKILEAVEEVNQKQKLILLDPLYTHFNKNLSGKKIALWGLSFKPDTDDIRDASSLDMIKELLKMGAKISAYDPAAMENVKKIYPQQIEYCTDMYQATIEADAIIIATEWPEFRNPDFDRLRTNMKSVAIFDGRNLFDLNEVKEENIFYKSIGRKTIHNGIK